MDLKKLPVFQHVKWDPDRQELRKFALWMLIGFGVLGALSAWRHHGPAAPSLWLWGIGGGLALVASLPGIGKFAYYAVYLTTGPIGFVVSRTLLASIFYLVFAPLGLLLRLTGKDLLRVKREPSVPMWRPHQGNSDRKRYYRQF